MSKPTPIWLKVIANAARVLLGVVFLYAGVPKLLNMDAFSTSIYFYQFLPDVYIGVMATMLPGVEIIAVLGLALRKWRPAAELLIAAMLVMFIIAVGIALVRGLDIGCGCFSTDHPRKLSSNLLMQDAGLLLLCFVCLYESWRSKPTE
jgi:uncharacterized membrane protein YphA (DoxX/SURF4 family)